MMEVMTLMTTMVEMVMMMVMVMVRPGIAAKVHCGIAIYIYCRFRGRCILRSAMHTAPVSYTHLTLPTILLV